jgi:hypothetical protein
MRLQLMAHLAAAAATAVTLSSCLALSASAGWMQTRFDVSDSTLWVKQGIGGAPIDIRIPGSDIPEGSGPSGSISGFVNLVAPVVGSNLSSPTDGGGAISAFDVGISVDFQADFTGPLSLVADIRGTSDALNLGWAVGSVMSDVTQLPLGALVLAVETHLTCVSTSPFINGCEESLGSFPIDRTTTQPTTQSLTFPINQLATPGAASFTVNITLDLAGPDAITALPATLRLVGKEVPATRMMTTLVPEPGSMALLLGGIAGLLGLAAFGRRRR